MQRIELRGAVLGLCVAGLAGPLFWMFGDGYLHDYGWIAAVVAGVVLLLRVFQSERVGRQAEQEFYLLVDALSDWGAVADQRGRLLHVSPSAGKYLGTQAERLVGRYWEECCPPEDLPGLRQWLERVRPGGPRMHGPVPMEMPLPNGLRRQFTATLYRFDLAGVPLYLGLFRDVTEQQGLQQAMTRMDRLAAVAHLADGVAHNFNNIFGGIMLNAELMVGADEADQRLYAERITVGAGRGAELCRKLLTVARGEAPALRRIPVGPVIADLVSLFETETNRYGVTIHYSVTGDPAVQGDPNQLRQILLNLLFNAREAIGRNGTIFLQVRTVGGKVSIAISNSGPPIPEAHLPLIFMPFFSTKTDHVQGTGLGLAICQSLAAGMHGDIQVDTGPDRPTAFTLTLPAALAGRENGSCAS